MARERDLDRALAHPERTKISFHGGRIADRYGDDELAVLAALPIEEISLLEQRITRLPPLQSTLRWLWVGKCDLEALDEIERFVSLQTLWLTELPRLDWARLFAKLSELPELTKLRIGGSSLRVLPEVARIPSLISVRLEDCPELDFAGAFARLGALPTLRDLEISIDRILPDAFAPLTQITRLYLRGTSGELTSIAAMTNLVTLEIDRCWYKTLPASIGRLQNLETLKIQDSALETLPDEVCDLAALQSLTLDETKVKELPAQLGRLAKLRHLDLRTRKLKRLPESIGDLAALRELSISSFCDKLVVPDSCSRLSLEKLSGPPSIEAKVTLRPAPTPIEDRVWIHDPDRIPADFGDPLELTIKLPEHTAPLPQLAQLRRLKQITLDVGNLADACARLVHAPQLRKLHIEGERERLPVELGDLVQLTQLAIESGSTITPSERGTLVALPDTIGKLADLETLVVTRHRLTALPETLGKLAALKSLHLDGGELTALPDSLGELSRLERFTLKVDKVERLPETLAQCPVLADVTLDAWQVGECRLANLPLVGKMPALRRLLLRGMSIFLAPTIDALAGGPLEELDLTNARLVSLPASIGGLANLRVLHLEGTGLTGLAPELRACGALRWISIPYTLATEVKNKLKDHLPKGRWKRNYRSGTTWYERSDP